MKKKSRVKVCDDLWKKVIKKRADFKCERCGSKEYIQAHHIIPRTDYSLRYDLMNGIALCRGCHLYWAHKDALGFVNWLKENAIRNYEYLENERGGIVKNDYQFIEDYLTKELEK